MEVGTNFDSWPCRDSNDDMKSETKIGGVLAPLTATGSPLSSVSPAQLLSPPELQRRADAHRRRGVSRRTAAVRLHLFSSKPAAAFHHHLEQKKVLTPLGNMS